MAMPEVGKCALVLDGDLPVGRLANAAVVLGVTLGAMMPDLPGKDVTDASGDGHPGLYPSGLPVLRASAGALPGIRARARELGAEVVGFPAVGQTTTDYDEFVAKMGATEAEDVVYLGLLIAGPAKAVNRATGSLPLLR